MVGSASDPTAPPSPMMPAPTSASDVQRSEELVTYVRDCQSSGIPIEICYQCFGDPKAGNPVVLLVCGLNMQLYAWDEGFCEDLVRAGFFVIRFDNRDIGHSTKVEQIGSVVGPRLLLPGKWATFFGERLPYSISSMARDALALLDALGVEKAHVFGISMGGAIAQNIAILAPHRIMSLTSLMSSSSGQDLPDPQLSVKLWMLRQPPKGCTIDELLDFRVHSLRHLLDHALPVDGAYLKGRYLMSLKRSSYSAGLVRQAAALRRAESRDAALREMTIPALVIHGAQDVVVPPIHGYRTAQCLPHSRLLVFKSMGHYFHPAFFPAIVTAFADMAATTSSVGGSPLQGTQLYRSFVPGFHAPRAADSRGSGGGERRAPQDKTFPANAADAAARERAATTAAAAEAVSPTTDNVALSNDLAASLEGKLDLTNEQLMASIGPYLFPVVTSAYSKTGKAAIALVNTAIPITGSIPVPEAVLLDLHEPVPSMSNAAVLTNRRPSKASSPANSPTSSAPGLNGASAAAVVVPELGGVGRVQGVAVVAARSIPKTVTSSSSSPALKASPAAPPPPPPPAPIPPPTTTAPVAAAATPSAAPQTQAPTVTEKLSRWWGSVVAKTAATATTTTAAPAPAPPATDATSAPSASSDAVKTSGAEAPTHPGPPVPTTTTGPGHTAASAPGVVDAGLEIEDVVEPFVPGSPSTWNKARFPTSMAAAAASPASPSSAAAPVASPRGAPVDEEAESETAPSPIRLVGVPLKVHIQRLHEKEQQRRRQLEQQQKKAQAPSQSSRQSGPAKPTFGSPLAHGAVKGMVPAPGVISKKPVDSTAANGVTPMVPSEAVNEEDNNTAPDTRNEDDTTGAYNPEWNSGSDVDKAEGDNDDVYTRAASTYDIAATLLAPGLPTETDDAVISALPSPTEKEIETAQRSLTSTP